MYQNSRTLFPTRTLPSVRSSGSSARASTTARAVPTKWDLQRIPGDGNCLYTSLAVGAEMARTGSTRSAFQIGEEAAASLKMRQDIFRELIKRRADVEPFLEVPFEQYAVYQKTPGTWGGEIELSVSPYVVQNKVQVYQQEGRGLMMISEYGAEEFKDTKRPVTLFFHKQGHYDVLIDLSGTDGPKSKL